MDCIKTGSLIRRLRTELGLTQRQLAESIGVSDKAVSKWERSLGCPDISLLSPLARQLGVTPETLLQGEMQESLLVGGNMKNTSFYICPTCGNLIMATSPAQLSCCGKLLEPMAPQKAEREGKLQVQQVEDEWFITSGHPMDKENYITFVALLSGGKLQVIRQYPEWELQLRLSRREHGKLIWHSLKDGLFYQLI